MINSLHGIVTEVTESFVVLAISGISLRVSVANGLSFSKDQTISLITHLIWHPEQGPSLFGFSSGVERDVFTLIITCPGIGPKIGIAVLRDIGAHGFLRAITTSNAKSLSSVSGIGLKKAEQIIVQLKHKVEKLIDSGDMVSEIEDALPLVEVAQALAALHYSRPEITKAIDVVRGAQDYQQLTFDVALRKALQFLSK
jgi:Holliday junction DNA helicase RuvA